MSNGPIIRTSGKVNIGGRVHSVYDHMEFPAYEFQEFPESLMPPDGGDPVVVQDAEQEAAQIKAWAKLPPRRSVEATAEKKAEPKRHDGDSPDPVADFLGIPRRDFGIPHSSP